jgi:hypothetical protein
MITILNTNNNYYYLKIINILYLLFKFLNMVYQKN